MADLSTQFDVRQLVGDWSIDAAHSNMGFAVKHMMFSTVRGGFSQFSGQFTIAEDIGQSRAEVRIKADSINTGNADRDGHLRSGDFLDVERYPELVFRARGGEIVDEHRGRIHGELTVRDQTLPVTVDVEFNGIVPKDIYGQPRAAFSAVAEVNRKDFGLTWNQTLETGGVLVGDKVKIEIEVAATRPDQ